MRIRKKKWAEPELAVCPYYTNTPEKFRGRWKEFFGNDHPIELEIGCGKCTFVAEKAKRNPGINYIAMDIKSDMLGVGRRNIEHIFADTGENPKNIALVRCNVEMIDKAIAPEDGIAMMYINFCNPWPREKHKKRRLTPSSPSTSRCSPMRAFRSNISKRPFKAIPHSSSQKEA